MIGFQGSGRIEPHSLGNRYAEILLAGETIEYGYRQGGETFLLTSKRLILADVQGLTGKKAWYESVPYRNILRFAAETAGPLDSDNRLAIWLPGVAEPWTIRFKSASDMLAMHYQLAARILG